jgi:hypothetical protein
LSCKVSLFFILNTGNGVSDPGNQKKTVFCRITAKKISFIASFIRFYPEYVNVMCPQQNDTPFPAFHSPWHSFVKDKAALVDPPTHSGNTETDTPWNTGMSGSVPVHDCTARPPLPGDRAGSGM